MTTTTNIFPRLHHYDSIVPEADGQPYDGYTVLEDGTILRLVGDGTGHDERGLQYTCVSRMVEDEEFEVLGWVKSSEVAYE